MWRNVWNINHIRGFFKDIAITRSLRKYTRQYTLFLRKLSSILVIKVEVYRRRSEDAERRRKKETASENPSQCSNEGISWWHILIS